MTEHNDSLIPTEGYLEQVSKQIRNKEYSLSTLIIDPDKPKRNNKEVKNDQK